MNRLQIVAKQAASGARLSIISAHLRAEQAEQAAMVAWLAADDALATFRAAEAERIKAVSDAVLTSILR